MKKAIDVRKLLFENMVKLNPNFKIKEEIKSKELLKEAEEKWIQKAVNPEHKGYCTPMTKPTCTPARKALAKKFKKGIDEDEIGVMPASEEVPTPETGIKFRADVVGKNEDVWTSNGIEYNTEEEAKAWLDNLSGRWFGYDMGRVVPTTTPQRQPVDMQNDVIYQNFRD
jgi:hypothetical protein